MRPQNQFKLFFAKNLPLKSMYRWLRASSTVILYNLSPGLLTKHRYRRLKGRWPNLKNPQSFDEKLIWLNLYWRHPLKARCGDKFTMRSYVTDRGLEHLLPNLLGVYESVDKINFNTFPQRFVLKCTHGCGFNIVCKDKSILDIAETKRTLSKWMKVDFSKIYGELHYTEMKPRIICENYLEELGSDLPSDYKIFCFYGKVYCTMACTGRSLNGRANYDIYDRDWTTKLSYSKTSLLANRNIPKPEAYEEMIAAAEVLSKPFPFVRMDFYSIKGKAVIGEMTFTPDGCIDVNLTDLAQRILGELVKIPEKRIR